MKLTTSSQYSTRTAHYNSRQYQEESKVEDEAERKAELRGRNLADKFSDVQTNERRK